MVSVGNDISVNGGVGSGERMFPPQSGLAYSTWVYIDEFGTQLNPLVSSPTKTAPSSTPSTPSEPPSTAAKQIHPIKILTLIKHSKVRDTLTSCRTVYLSPKNQPIFIHKNRRVFA